MTVRRCPPGQARTGACPVLLGGSSSTDAVDGRASPHPVRPQVLLRV